MSLPIKLNEIFRKMQKQSHRGSFHPIKNSAKFLLVGDNRAAQQYVKTLFSAIHKMGIERQCIPQNQKHRNFQKFPRTIFEKMVMGNCSNIAGGIQIYSQALGQEQQSQCTKAMYQGEMSKKTQLHETKNKKPLTRVLS